jgi:hypothetical protein
MIRLFDGRLAVTRAHAGAPVQERSEAEDPLVPAISASQSIRAFTPVFAGYAVNALVEPGPFRALAFGTVPRRDKEMDGPAPRPNAACGAPSHRLR